MSNIDPTREQIEALAAGDMEAPITMINLLRFREQAGYPDDFEAEPCSGEQAYGRYAEGALAAVAKVGGRPIWGADAHQVVIGPEAERWDQAFLVHYPSRAKFLEMVADPTTRRSSRTAPRRSSDSRLILCDAPERGAGDVRRRLSRLSRARRCRRARPPPVEVVDLRGAGARRTAHRRDLRSPSSGRSPSRRGSIRRSPTRLVIRLRSQNSSRALFGMKIRSCRASTPSTISSAQRVTEVVAFTGQGSCERMSRKRLEIVLGLANDRVSIHDGWMLVAHTPRQPTSARSARVNNSTPAFEAL